MEKFEVNYYTGKSSVCNRAFLYLKKDCWEIRFVNSISGEDEVVLWKTDLIHVAQTSGGITVFKYGNFPHETIEYTNEYLTQKIQNTYQKEFFKKVDLFISKINYTKLVLIFASILVFMACIYIFFIPFVAVQMVENMPKHYDEDLGEYVFKQMSGELKVDPIETNLVNEYAEQINFNSPYIIKIHVVEDSTVNAFALPGGNIVVYKGILKKMSHKEELAALLAHEVSHVNHRHSIKSIAKSLSGYIFLSIIINDVNGITSTLLSNADMFNSLKYSRSLEEEADSEGLKILDNNHIDQKGFVYLFETLEKEDNSLMNIELLSSHPLTEDRMNHAKEEAQKQQNIQDNKELEMIWKEIKQTL